MRMTTLPGTPRRIRGERTPPSPERKLDVETLDPAGIVPARVRIDVAGGRSSTASAMRAARVTQEVEGVGGYAETVELEGARATLDAEIDHDQATHIARHPFVRRIRSST